MDPRTPLGVFASTTCSVPSPKVYVLPLERERLADTQPGVSEQTEQDTTETGATVRRLRRIEQRHELFRLGPRSGGPRRFQAPTLARRRVRADEPVLDGRLEDLSQVPKRVIDAAVREATLRESFAAFLSCLACGVDLRPLLRLRHLVLVALRVKIPRHAPTERRCPAAQVHPRKAPAEIKARGTTGTPPRPRTHSLQKQRLRSPGRGR
jgi:hypothetical protein